MAMDEKHLVAYGAIGVGALVVLVVFSRGSKSSTTYATDPNVAANNSAILAANTAAISQGASLQNTRVAAATTLALDSNNNQTQIAIAGISASSMRDKNQADIMMGGISASSIHDKNQTDIAIAANEGATQVSLAHVSAAATLKSAEMTQAALVQHDLLQADVLKYTSDVNAGLGKYAAWIAEKGGTQRAYYEAQTAVAVSKDNTDAAKTAAYYGSVNTSNTINGQLVAANLNHDTQIQVAQATAGAYTTAAVASANAQKSASKNAMWGQIAGAVANIFTGGASGAAGSLSGAQSAGSVQGSQSVGPYTNSINPAFLPQTYPSYNPPPSIPALTKV